MNPWVTALISVLLLLVIMLVNGSMTIYMLRKVLGHLHLRLGPTELGPAGIAQLIPDIVKLLVKEDRHPTVTDYWTYAIAPFIVFVPGLVSYALIPFSDKLVAADMRYGLLMIVAVLSIIPLGIFAAGFASHNKYSLIGAMRAVGAAICYEVPLVLSAIVPVMLAGSLNLIEIVQAQIDSLWFIIPAFPSAVLFFICALMETSNVPFDLAEAETELIAGFSTEYSAMRFGFMYLTEFSNNFILGGLMVALFFGGWTLPFVPAEITAPIAPVIFVLKTYLVIFCFMVVKGSFSRFRVDQMASLGFKILVPIALIWALVFGVGYKIVLMTLGGGA